MDAVSQVMSVFSVLGCIHEKFQLDFICAFLLYRLFIMIAMIKRAVAGLVVDAEHAPGKFPRGRCVLRQDRAPEGRGKLANEPSDALRG